MSIYTLFSNKGKFFDKDFPGINEAQDYAAKHFADSVGLPEGKYYLQWEVTLRDKEYNRAYISKDRLYTIVVREI